MFSFSYFDFTSSRCLTDYREKMPFSTLKAAALLWLINSSATFTLAQSQNSTKTRLKSLARDVERVESIREIKDVQRSFAQLAQFGRWDDMGSLFSPNGSMQWDMSIAVDPDEVASFFERDDGNMSGSLSNPGSLNTILIECPLVNLAADGLSARARWNSMRFMGDGIGNTRIEGGIMENEYLKTEEGWKITFLNHTTMFRGNYETGWKNFGSGNLSIVPYHFTPNEAGVPIPSSIDPAPNTTATVSGLAARIERLNDEDAVRNLQHAYGYYVDRKMWPDVLDLFVPSPASSITINGLGTATGRDAIAAALEQSMGPENLTTGVLNEHLQLDTIVSIDPSGTTAMTRGIEIALLGDGKGGAGWEFGVFCNTFLKDDDGIWKLQELHLTPIITANYSSGWGNGSLSPSPTAIPSFLDISRRLNYPVPIPNPHSEKATKLAVLERALNRSKAFDGVENVSSAYGYYAEDLQCTQLGDVHAVNGHKEAPFAGFYHGRERIAAACHTSYGFPNISNLRAVVTFHWRMQPVVLVSEDGRSASLRSRLLQPSTTFFGGNALRSGMYSDQFALENGVWKIWSLGIDQYYLDMPNWKVGWAYPIPVSLPSNSSITNITNVFNPTQVPIANQPPSPLLKAYPPDLLLTDVAEREEGFVGGTGKTVAWPDIHRMWWGYRNLVTGRVPDGLWEGCVPCRKEPTWNLTSNGYEEPPTGP
jgi:SnoaL-like domain